MTEAQAKAAMARGEIANYVVTADGQVLVKRTVGTRSADPNWSIPDRRTSR